ncbi:unnamed protein product [Gadus morhua 'NCC']
MPDYRGLSPTSSMKELPAVSHSRALSLSAWAGTVPLPRTYPPQPQDLCLVEETRPRGRDQAQGGGDQAQGGGDQAQGGGDQHAERILVPLSMLFYTYLRAVVNPPCSGPPSLQWSTLPAVFNPPCSGQPSLQWSTLPAVVHPPCSVPPSLQVPQAPGAEGPPDLKEEGRGKETQTPSDQHGKSFSDIRVY